MRVLFLFGYVFGSGISDGELRDSRHHHGMVAIDQDHVLVLSWMAQRNNSKQLVPLNPAVWSANPVERQ
jgi:hypothetical protein